MNKILVLFLTLPFLLIACGYNVEIPVPSSITAVINGEEFNDLKPGKAKFQMALNEAGKAIASALITWKKEKYTGDQVAAMMREESNAYALNYPKIITMKIWMSGGYTRTVQFNRIYVIHEGDMRKVFFYQPSKRVYKPYVPLTDSARMR